MKPQRHYFDFAVIDNTIDDAVFFGYSSRPKAGEFIFQRFGFPYASERIGFDGLNKR